MPNKNIEPDFCPECRGKIEYNSFEKSGTDCTDCGLVINRFFGNRSNRLKKKIV